MIKKYSITATVFDKHRSEKTGELMLKCSLFENYDLRHTEYIQLESANRNIRQKAQELIRNLLVNKSDFNQITEDNRNVESLFLLLVERTDYFKEITQITVDTTTDFPRLLNVTSVNTY